MHACGAPERGRVGRGERRRRPRTGQIRPGHHLARHAGRARAGDDLGQIAGEAVMRQVRADVDQFAAQEPPPCCVIFMLMCRVAIPVLLALSFAVSPSHAQEGGDLQAQILYAFQAEDTNQLADLVQSLSTQVKVGRRGRGAALPPGARRVPFWTAVGRAPRARCGGGAVGLHRPAQAVARARCQIGGGAGSAVRLLCQPRPVQAPGGEGARHRGRTTG